MGERESERAVQLKSEQERRGFEKGEEREENVNARIFFWACLELVAEHYTSEKGIRDG